MIMKHKTFKESFISEAEQNLTIYILHFEVVRKLGKTNVNAKLSNQSWEKHRDLIRLEENSNRILNPTAKLVMAC